MRWALTLGMAVVAFAMAAPGWWRPVEDPDLWWLLWAGEQGLPTVNGFSWTAPEQPWVLHEPAVAWLYSRVGLQGIAPLRGLLHAVLLATLTQLAWRPRSGWAGLVGLIWALPLVSLALSERAMAWGLLFAALQALAHHHGRHGLAALAVGAWAWVHGSFPLGVLVCLAWSPRHGLLALALTLPRAPVWLLSWSYLAGDGTLPLVRAHIAEWGWLVPNSLAQALRLLAVLASLWLARKRPILLLLLVPLALRHWRMCAPLGVFLLGPVVDGLRLPERPCLNPVPWLLGALLLVAVPSQASVLEPPLAPGEGALYNDLELGGWLGYRGHAPFWDPRNDCYPSEVYADGLRVAYAHDLEVLERWGVVQVLTADAELSRTLQASGFHVQQQAEGHVLLRRTE